KKAVARSSNVQKSPTRCRDAASGLCERLRILRLFRETQAAKVAEGVDAGGVTALERDLEGVLTDQDHVREAQLGVGQLPRLVEPAGGAPLTTALGAGACPAQAVAAQAALVLVVPGDL